MQLKVARLPTRVDAEGNLLRLKEQDRSRWDQALMARGLFHLARSGEGSDLGEYHLEAGIAACHCVARDNASRDWLHILSLHDRLVQIDSSPIVAFNRAVAVTHVHGPARGLAAVGAIRHRRKLNGYTCSTPSRANSMRSSPTPGQPPATSANPCSGPGSHRSGGFCRGEPGSARSSCPARATDPRHDR